MTTINQFLHDHRRHVLEQERHAASLDKTGTGTTAEMEIVSGQLERNMDAFTTDTKERWFADYENHYESDDDGHVMQQRARDLGIDGKDWQEYHRRREAAIGEF